jgi:hypothetical protein
MKSNNTRKKINPLTPGENKSNNSREKMKYNNTRKK